MHRTEAPLRSHRTRVGIYPIVGLTRSKVFGKSSEGLLSGLTALFPDDLDGSDPVVAGRQMT